MKIINRSKVGYGKIMWSNEAFIKYTEPDRIIRDNFWITKVEPIDLNYDYCYCFSPYFDPTDFSVPEYSFYMTADMHGTRIDDVFKIKRDIYGTII